jgi:hypothetical protein
MKRDLGTTKTKNITVALGSTGLIALTDPAITGSDVLVSFDARAEQDAIGLPPNVIRVPVGDDHTKDSLLATMAKLGVSGIEEIIKLLKYASGNLAEGLQGYGLMGWLYAMYLLTSQVWRDFVAQFSDAVYTNCKGATTLKVRFILSLSGGTGSGLFSVIIKAIEDLLHSLYPDVTIDIEIVVVGGETYRNLREQTQHNHAFFWVDLVGYLLALNGYVKDDKVTRKAIIFELAARGTDKDARRAELRMILPAIFSDSFGEVMLLSSNHTTYLNPWGAITLLRFGYKSDARQVDPLQFALANAEKSPQRQSRCDGIPKSSCQCQSYPRCGNDGPA